MTGSHSTASAAGIPAQDVDRDIVSIRSFPVSRQQVFQAWTDPARLARWWGPNGFTNSFEEFDLRPGGHWRFVMHGPDGKHYPNHSVFVEIAPERIVFDHLSEPRFRVTASFDTVETGTRVTFRMHFESKEIRDQVARYAVAANEQNFDRFAAELGLA